VSQPTALIEGVEQRAFTAPLAARGWVMASPDSGTPLQLAVLAPTLSSTEFTPWSPAVAMEAIAAAIEWLAQARPRLEAARGLAVIVTRRPASRSTAGDPAGGILAAGLAMAASLLSREWEPNARCLHLVRGMRTPEEVAAAAIWLAAEGAVPLSGQTVDLDALAHTSLRPTGSPVSSLP
jgi:hypothetical protein